MELTVFHQLGIALGLGLIVGLEREWASKTIAGIRTFPLITVFGALAAILAQLFGGWVLAAGVGGVAVMLWVGNAARLKSGGTDPGLTTEMAALVMFAVGAILVSGYVGLAVVTAGVVAVLLHWKAPLHALAERLGTGEFRAIVRLVLIGMVILPVLPDHGYGPYDVLNPFRIWLMVVLIVGISLAAYVVQRLLGSRIGTLLAGVLGGLISSTATTVSYARQSRDRTAETRAAAIVIITASTVVFGRVLLEVTVVAPEILGDVAPPLVAVMAFMALVSAVVFFAWRGGLAAPDAGEPPSDLKAAIVFGVLYAAVLFGVAWAKEHFGDVGVFAVAALSGLTDMDAITLSTAQLIGSEELDAATGWRLILVGAMANLLFKALVVAVIGRAELLGRIAALFALSFAAGAAVLIFWP